jgi:uncharacterized lipoprotein YajG
MRKMLVLAVLLLAACATDPTPQDRDKTQESSGPTVYGQVSVSIDHISTH